MTEICSAVTCTDACNEMQFVKRIVRIVILKNKRIVILRHRYMLKSVCVDINICACTCTHKHIHSLHFVVHLCILFLLQKQHNLEVYLVCTFFLYIYISKERETYRTVCNKPTESCFLRSVISTHWFKCVYGYQCIYVWMSVLFTHFCVIKNL